MPDRLTVLYDEQFLEHQPPAGEFEAAWTGRLAVEEPHPDRPERLLNIKTVIEQELGEHARWQSASPATREQLHRVHDPDYVDEIRAFSEAGGGRLTVETGGNEATYESAVHAAGTAIRAAELATDPGHAGIPYALVRPSGHHAQPAQVDGYCFFNNVALAAEAAIADGDPQRVAILDWDVHHGNGTQEAFYDRDDVLFVSVHNDHGSWDPEAHPQSGGLEEPGAGAGEGYNVNVPVPPGTGDRGYELVFDRIVEPITRAFEPDLLLVSAGQDAGTLDPLGRNCVTKAGFSALGRRVRQLSDELTGGRYALVQEGGYQISHLAYATLGVLEGVLGVETGIDDPFDWLNEDVESAERAIATARDHYRSYWDL